MRLRNSSALILLILFFPLYSWAQIVPAYSAKEIRGQVVDADTGRPLEGVVILARWNWYKFYQTLESSGYVISNDPLHLAEAVTDRNGNYDISAWGPKIRVEGQLSDHDDPRLMIFKSGYVPFEVRNDQNGYDDWERDSYLRMSRQTVKHNSNNVRSSEWNGKQIKLKKFTGTLKEYAEQITAFQNNGVRSVSREGGGLWWEQQNDNWKAMPKMILALHRQKRLLGDDGSSILGGYKLYGRSGQGSIVDAQNGQPVSTIVNITWIMHNAEGTKTHRQVEQRGWSEKFTISPWLMSVPQLDGWEIDYDNPPMVRVYSPGYINLPDTAWQESGMSLHMKKMLGNPESKETILGQMRTWRHDLNFEIMANPVLEDAVRSQKELLKLLQDECDKLTPKARTGICYERNSKVAIQLQRTLGSTSPMLTYETMDGPTHIKIMMVPSSTKMNDFSAAQAAPSPEAAPAVGGFSIKSGK